MQMRNMPVQQTLIMSIDCDFVCESIQVAQSVWKTISGASTPLGKCYNRCS